jgi:hypothetical protein
VAVARRTGKETRTAHPPVAFCKYTIAHDTTLQHGTQLNAPVVTHLATGLEPPTPAPTIPLPREDTLPCSPVLPVAWGPRPAALLARMCCLPMAPLPPLGAGAVRVSPLPGRVLGAGLPCLQSIQTVRYKQL